MRSCQQGPCSGASDLVDVQVDLQNSSTGPDQHTNIKKPHSQHTQPHTHGCGHSKETEQILFTPQQSSRVTHTHTQVSRRAHSHQGIQLVQHGQHQLQLVCGLAQVDEDILAQQLLANLIVRAPARSNTHRQAVGSHTLITPQHPLLQQHTQWLNPHCGKIAA